MNVSLDYQNRFVVVTGCYSGIGRATAQLLTALGARVCGIDINQPDYALEQFIHADFCSPQSVSNIPGQLSEPVFGLFNCAGVSPSQDENKILSVNFLATRQLTKLIIERMPEGSAIVSVGSIGGSGWQKNSAKLVEFLQLKDDATAKAWYEKHSHIATDAYCFSKEAIVVWTKWLSKTLIKQGIRINCTAPGATQTPMLTDIEQNVPGSDVDRVTQPIGRRSTANEQAWALVMLNSPQASYINGVDLAVDGGAVSMQVT